MWYEIERKDVYKDFYNVKDKFDFSDYLENSKFYDKTSTKIITKFEDEASGVPIIEFIGLRSKMYSCIPSKDSILKMEKYDIKWLKLLIFERHVQTLTQEGGGGCIECTCTPHLIKRSAQSDKIRQDKNNQRKGINESTFLCFLKIRSSLKCPPPPPAGKAAYAPDVYKRSNTSL